MAKARYKIQTGADPGENFIRILRGTQEVLYWDQQEWIDDPSLVVPIANAVAMAAGDSEMMDVKLKEMGIL